jgi:2-polyprenyl-6-methoxyphenol hydroxylase-like FAD-dependent oxidoreductase
MAATRSTPVRLSSSHAVVIGAGMGGLLAAQALSNHVERVTLIERDDLPEEPATRSGVPQGRHVHVLQPGGLGAIERLLPGFGAELVAHGAVRLELPREICWMSSAGWMQPFDDRTRLLLSASRDLIEWVTRCRVLTTPQVIMRTGLQVAGLVYDGSPGNGAVVRGIDVRPRAAGSGAPVERIEADLVIDASGRRSPAPAWLEAAGYGRPAETTVDADLAYATRTYRRSAGDVDGWKCVFLQARPPHTSRMAVMFPIEGDRWMVTLAGANGDHPPTDEEGFLAFARGLRAPTVADALERLEPLTPIVGYQRTDNRRRHYESMRLPDRLIIVGDAACAFNPVYGQGMSVAALTAESLDHCLGRHLARRGTFAGATPAAQRAVAKANAGAWTVSTGEDMRYPGTTGARGGAADRIARRYFDRLVRVAAVDPVANAALVDVITMVAEPTSLFRPALVARVLAGRHPAPRQQQPPAPASPTVPASAA